MTFHEFYNVINGELVTTNQTRHGINPSTLEANPQVPLSAHGDVEKVVRAAKGVGVAVVWELVSLADRQKPVIQFANAIVEHKEDFANMLT